ncbi:Cyclin-dependent kinase G-2 [Linum perenne]
MASGRHGVYRDYEFREREAGFELSRKDSGYSKERYDRTGNGNREYDRERVRVRDLKDGSNGRARQREMKEREVVNGANRCSSSRSNSGSSGSGRGEGASGPRRCDFAVRAVDREPGELSSDSGSDGGIESESQVDKDKEVSKVVENGITRAPVEKKRKFSPIVWDRDGKEVSNSSEIRVHKEVVPTLPLPPPPPLPMPKLQHELPDVTVDVTVGTSPTRIDKNEKSQPSSPVRDPDAKRSADSESPVEFEAPTLVSEGYKQNEGLQPEALEDEDYVPTRHISSSRWAAGNNSPADEGEIVEDQEMPKRRKKAPYPDSSDSKVRSKSATPEPGDLKREGSEGANGRSSASDEPGSRPRSSSRDEYPNNDSERDEYMEVDGDREYKDRNNVNLDTDSEDDDSSPETPEPAGPPQRSISMLRGCRSVDEFERLNKIDEGTYGVVFRAKDKKTGEIVALKKVKMEKEREGFPLTSLREINILLSFHHPSIVDVKEVVVGSSLDSIFMVMEYMEHDLKGLMESMKQPFSQSEVKCLMLQLLEGTKYLHDNWVLHRDLKTSNILLNNRGELKICDFGLARQYGSPLKPYTHMVVTLWYRAPELLLGAEQYSTAIDMWSLGCIMAEMLSKQPLFNGKTEVDQLDKIFRILGTPNETIWPGFSKLPRVKVNFVKHQYNLLRKKFPATSFTGSPVLSDAGFDLLNKLLTYDPEKRITVDAALNHEWFREVPLPKSKDFMPTFPAQHAQDRRLRRIMKSPDPLEEQRRKELRQAELGTGGLFG